MNNKTVWRAEYDEWGNMLREDNPDNLQQLIRLPGQQYDNETGLYYNRYRYYDPLQHRYITQDPIGLEGGWNLYQYPLDPITRIDPLGLKSFNFPAYHSKNIDDIGNYALAMCNVKSIKENTEYGGIICKKDDDYFALNPIVGNNHQVDLRSMKCPVGLKRVGEYHTHGYYSDLQGNITLKESDAYDSLHFSSADIFNANIYGLGNKEYTSYLGTPDGTYLKFDTKKSGDGISVLKNGVQ